MATPTVLVLGHRFPDLEIEQGILAREARLVDGNGLGAEELAEALSLASAILLGTGVSLDARRVALLANCKAIVRYGIGVDNVDVGEATRRGVVVANVPDYCLDEVSDHAVALVLAAARRLPDWHARVRAGSWNGRTIPGVRRLRGQRAGIIGLGRIGRLVAAKLQAFGLAILGFDPFASAAGLGTLGVSLVSCEQLLQESDYVLLHCPLTDETRHLINRRTLAMMKPTAWLINTSRGGLVDEAALLEALDGDRIGGAALDVLAEEPPLAGNPLVGHERVWITPHVAWYSEDSKEELRRRAAEQVWVALRGGTPPHALNAGS